MGFAHEDEVLTPNMDAFAANSVYCENATSTFPLCSPHRACLFSGRYPAATGVYTNCKPGLTMRLADGERCIAEVQREHGYQTGYIGKWHLDEPEINHSAEPVSGARAWDAFTPRGVRRHGFDFWYSYGAWDAHLNPHYWQDTPEMIRVEQWSPAHETDVAIRYLETRDKEKPFSLFISWNPPHSPYEQVPQKYLDLYKDKELTLRGNVDFANIHHHTSEAVGYTEAEMHEVTKQYFAAISGLDDQFGRLLQALRDEGVLEDTIVVLTADHGDMMGSHALMAKHVWYEESVGIPCVIGGAGLASGRCGTVLDSADIAPTLLSLMGLPVPAEMQGKDCANEIRTCKTDENKVGYLYATPGGPQLVAALKEKGISPLEMGWRGVRSVRYSYVVDVGYTPTPVLQRLLYDLASDPLQMHPIVIENPADNAVANELEQALLQWLHEQNDSLARHLQ